MYFIVFNLLRCNSKDTIKELANMFDVSTKTIQRDLDKLTVLGIPITVHRGENGGVEIDKAIDYKYSLTLHLENNILNIFPIKYALRKEGLCLYCYQVEYLLILIDKILKDTICDESYNGTIIDYEDNKINVKLIY